MLGEKLSSVECEKRVHTSESKVSFTLTNYFTYTCACCKHKAFYGCLLLQKREALKCKSVSGTESRVQRAHSLANTCDPIQTDHRMCPANVTAILYVASH